MHELLNQLSNQAKSTIPQFIEVDEWIKQYNHNFARLIIEECTETCLRMQLGNQYTPEEMLFQTKYRNLIKKHFGVSDE